jgi:Signal transduction histidine kinase involved in nitrogen fixation and metabolism regulation
MEIRGEEEGHARTVEQSRDSVRRNSDVDAEGLEHVGAAALRGVTAVAVFGDPDPAAATTNPAAVEMLKVPTVPPPVPQVSTIGEPADGFTVIIAWRSAWAAPAISSNVSPLARRPSNKALIWSAVASPRMMTPKAAAAWPAVRSCPCSRDVSALSSGRADWSVEVIT